MSPENGLTLENQNDIYTFAKPGENLDPNRSTDALQKEKIVKEKNM